MTKVAIMPVPALKSDESVAIIVLQNFRPDTFFSAAQQQRLEALMQRWRTARDTGKTLPQQEQDELEQLVEQELVASASRANTSYTQLPV